MQRFKNKLLTQFLTDIGVTTDWTEPEVRIIDESTDLALNGLSVVNLRAGLLSISDLSGNDQYSFYRDAYLQRREYEINDGKIDDSLFDDEFD